MTLRFRKEDFLRDLVDVLREATDEAAEHVLQGLVSQGHSKAERERMRREAAQYFNKEITAAIESGGMWALITNYGSGGNMDKDNLAEVDYIGSEYWNPLRKSLEIVGRPAGPYPNLDGKESISTGRKAGQPIKLKNYPAEHWFERIVQLSRPTVYAYWSQAVREFPIHRYISG